MHYVFVDGAACCQLSQFSVFASSQNAAYLKNSPTYRFGFPVAVVLQPWETAASLNPPNKKTVAGEVHFSAG